MVRDNLTFKALTKRVYAKGGGEFIRTIPTKGKDSPYIGYIKTTLGEAEVAYDNRVLFEVLVNGDEITEKEYCESELKVINTI